MRSVSTVFLTLSLIFLISCTHAVLKQDEIDPWLNTISGGQPPKIDVAGKWQDAQDNPFFSFGEGYLRQEQNEISGAIGKYNIKGVVSGKIGYLVFLYRGSVYYTARLEMFRDLLTGNFFEASDKEQIRGYPTSFARTSTQP